MIAHLKTEDTSLGISVVIPCLNEENTIEAVVHQAREAVGTTGLSCEIIVVNNGSTDSTGERARLAGAHVLDLTTRGYGMALDFGIRHARYEWIVMIDGDLSYPLDELPRLIEPLRSDRADLVLGSRLRGIIDHDAMPWTHRWVGTPFLSWLIRLLHCIPTSDTTSGMRAIRRSVYPRLKLKAKGMEFGAEMLVSVARCGLRYDEVPIRYRRDERNRGSHLRTYRDGIRFLRAILASQ